jgi:phage terminase small subunit
MAGRPRKPSALRVLEGNRSRTDIPPEPELNGVPECPECLDAVGAAHFNFVTAELAAAGIVKRIDSEALSTLADVWSDFWRASEALRGPLDIESAKEARMLKYAAARSWWSGAGKFGLTPADRAKLMAPVANKPDADEERFFKVTG